MNRVTFPLKLQRRGRKVADLQDALKLVLDRGDIVANDPASRRELAAGLQRERERRYFGRFTRKLVATFQQEHQLQPTGEVDKPTSNSINVLLLEWGELEEPGEDEPPEGATFVVRGRVVGPDPRGLSGLRAVAVDRNVGRVVRLGETTSGELGAYEIRYSIARLDKEQPDVQVQVLGQDGEVLATSAVRYNAGPEEKGLDVEVPAEKLPRPAEYPRLIGELSPHLDAREEPQLKQRLGALQEDDEQQDITYLANKTGWDARAVAMSVLASQYSERSGVEAEFYYALFRAGVPANEAALSQLAPETVRQTWERAVEHEILPAELKERIPESLDRFRAHSAGRLLEEPAEIGVSGFKELLEGALPDSEAQQRFARLYYDRRSDLGSFWEQAREEFGADVADRLQVNGKLAFLTINNAPLIQRLHAGDGDLHEPLDLVRRGLYRQEAWEELLDEDVAIPDEVPGEEPEQKKANYAAYMASQLRLSYPTAVVAEMVRADSIPLRADSPVKTAVTQFLEEHQGKFELGLHPVEHYLRRNDVELGGSDLGEEQKHDALAQVKKLQRVYQISPSDEAMGKLLEHDLDSAYDVVRYDEQSFVGAFKNELGGQPAARLSYAKAHQVHHAVLNIATNYLLERSAPSLYAIDNLPARNGAQSTPAALTAEESGVMAYPTLEGIFGEMDYCACEHCRSWLSPAAYLVDLLQFLDPPAHERQNPLEVLLGRRPDIKHLQLTCENTNTVLPYIDLVNEVLEHFVVNGSLATFAGHNIEEGVSTEELLANPQFVDDAAYAQLRNQVFPPPLPFHQPLEAVRRYFEHFDVPLHEAMERLRVNDNVERDGDPDDPAYGWRDVLMERLRLSRQEYAVLTDSGTPLQTLYGEDPDAVTVDELIEELSNAKKYSRRLGLTYEELIEIARTRFINPHSRLIPRLEKLSVDFATIQAFLDGMLSEEEFRALVPIDELDMTQYGGSAEQSEDEKFAQLTQWLEDNVNEIMSLIVLSDPAEGEDLCSFDTVELRYALPDFERNRLRPIEFLKLLRFIRLWRKLGWSIEQTDEALAALYPGDGADADTDEDRLDGGFRTLIERLAHLQTVVERLELSPRRDLQQLLACWSSIDTHGYRSLYRRMFGNPSVLAPEDVFEEDGYGGYLAEKKELRERGAETPRLIAHTETLRAAFNLTREEFDLIVEELDFDHETVLNLANVSAVFRHGFLARKLGLSVREVLALKSLSGLDPFQPLDLVRPPDRAQPHGAVRPQAIRFIEIVQRIEASPFTVSQLLYFLHYTDWSGKASPPEEDVLDFARRLRKDLVRLDREHEVQDDPGGEIAREEMALVYGNEATDTFFGLLNETAPFAVDYSHAQEELEETIRRITDRISYDHFRKQLTFRGVLREAVRDDLKAVPGVSEEFARAVDALHVKSGKFFERYPDLKEPYENFVDSDDPLEDRMSALLADLLPELLPRLKRQQARQTVSAQVDADLTLLTPLLEDPALLHALSNPAEPAIADFLALGKQGVSADVFFADDVTGDADRADVPVSSIDYRQDGTALPPNPAGEGATISGRWRGFVEAPDNGFYNFYVETDAREDPALKLDGQEVDLAQTDGIWSNQDPIELRTGRLYALELTARQVKDKLVLKWKAEGMGRTTIVAKYLYPAGLMERFKAAYLRLLKALAIVEPLALKPAELEHFATHEDYLIDGNEEGWLNALPVEPSSDWETAQQLLENVLALVRYRALEEELRTGDERLLEVLQDPAATGEDGEPLLERFTGWREADLTALLDHFGVATTDLIHLQHLVRLHEAFAIVEKLNVGGATLLETTTNEPDPDTLRGLQGALRARYDDSAEPVTSLAAIGEMPAKGALPTNRDWLNVIRPIADELRALQRDALVTFVLHKLGQDETTKHIDTPEKLFEHFLIDVQMDSCMKTSRIRQALSSVQLFVQRCLMSLEDQVASSSINAGQWEWMKRYRIWEANRKVFLWPENWLEPELRDDKSLFFGELESELLESDITDDAAATALMHYLEKLDEVAKLEICGMYYEENEAGNPADDVVHVIGRTAGARRTYYYRRLEGSSWSPWEKIDLQIEDNPVLPMVWQGRLFLFWLSVLEETPEQDSSGDSNDEDPRLTSARLSDLEGLSGEAKTRVTATLYWSEYYNRKWQAAKTSDPKRPIEVGTFPPSGNRAFGRRGLDLRGVTDEAGSLYVYLGYNADRAPHNLLGRYGSGHLLWGYFKFYNTHAVPVRDGDDTDNEDRPAAWPYLRLVSLHSSGTGVLRVRHGEYSREDSRYSYEIVNSDTILHRRRLPGASAVDPRHDMEDPFLAPFFFQDQRHAFFVRTGKVPNVVSRHEDVMLTIGFDVAPAVPPLIDPVLEPMPGPRRESLPEPWLDDTSIGEAVTVLGSERAGGIVTPQRDLAAPQRAATIHRVLGTSTFLPFGGRDIGVDGSVPIGLDRSGPRRTMAPRGSRLLAAANVFHDPAADLGLQRELVTRSDRESVPRRRDHRGIVTRDEKDAKYTYTFYNHFHPFVGELLGRLNKNSINGLLDANFHESLKSEFFEEAYKLLGVISTQEDHDDRVNSVAFNHDGSQLVSGSDDNSLILWEVHNRRLTRRSTLEGHSGSVRSVAFNHDGSQLVSGSNDDTLILWDASGTESPEKRTLVGHSGSVHSVAFNHDGNFVASGSSDNTVIVWDVSDARRLRRRTLDEHSDWVRSVAFSPDGRLMASGSNDTTVILWDMSNPRDPQKRSVLRGHRDRVQSVAFNHAGTVVASGSSDRTVILWDVSDPEHAKRRSTLRGHSDRVRSVTFNHDGNVLVSGSNDNNLVLWNVSDSRRPSKRSTLEGHTDIVRDVAFNHDGSRVASGSFDNTVMLWDVFDAHGSFPKEIDVSEDGAYSVYNWELLFHAPLTIAVHLSKQQRFAEAQRWFHYIFDPTTNDGQFWRFLAFRKEKDFKQIDELLRLVSKPEDELSDEERERKEEVLIAYETARTDPFQPHAVARTRFLAYQYSVVMKYLDNLIAWGDSLFRQDTIESINEATQIYVLAANLLGPRPQRIPRRGAATAQTFAQLRAKGLDELGNALVELEGQFPFNLYFPATEGVDTDRTNTLFGIGRALYFCIPRNDKLLGYWDTVADRLFKIRHCMSIEGVVRQLPLFEPPIDPGMLVKAAAAGIDISSLVSGLNQPLTPVRSTLLNQKALEICSEVRGLGNALLSALEKKDAEALGLLRQKHEINIQQLAQDVRYLQWKEAEAATDSLVSSRESALERYRHHRRLLGKDDMASELEDLSLERRDLTEENFDGAYEELVGQYAQDIDVEEYPSFEASDGDGLHLNRNEDMALNEHAPASRKKRSQARWANITASGAVFLPGFDVNMHYWGIGGTVKIPGGDAVATAGRIAAEYLSTEAALEDSHGASARETASYERRADDWVLQSNLAALELMQIGRQIISSLIREQITRHEYENVKKQIEQAQETDQFLRDKFTNEELYGWMHGELSKLYYEYYKFAFDIARKAEQTVKHELMRPELDETEFIKFNYWDGGRKGLLSGEALYLDLKRLEMAYHDHNKREYELTKHVSLRQLDPVALLKLKASGACELTLPEWLFDLDTPGHYMRRIKNVSLSIPAVTGPYTSVNCTLSLQKSTLRRSPRLREGEYKRATDGEDARFVDYYGTIQSIVTSNAQDDNGMFETNLRDERFLPFEGAGAISTWKLELPNNFRQFDYDSISDVILHLRYTARAGGSLLAQKATERLRDLVEEANTSGLVRLFSLQHDFPSEWHRFASGEEDFQATVRKEYFPYLAQGREIRIHKVEVYSVTEGDLKARAPASADSEEELEEMNESLKQDSELEMVLSGDDVPEDLAESPQVFVLFGYAFE